MGLEELKLKHEYLLSPEGGKLPNGIPIYPRVRLSDFIYETPFIQEVMKAVPDFMMQDVETINKKLGRSHKLEIKDNYITQIDSKGRKETLPTEQIMFESSRKEGYLIVRTEKYQQLILDTPPRTDLIHHRERNIPEKILREYFLPSGWREIYTWKTTNTRFNSSLGMHYLRNFAIAFNNLGLAELAKK